MNTPVSVSAVLPAYNEAAVIADVLRRTAAALAGADLQSFEIVVVDDGSDDDTAAIVCALDGELGALVVGHRQNRGYGAALRSGFEAARSEAVWLMDSDGQFDPSDLHLLLPLYRYDRLVAGYRAHRRDRFLRRGYHAAFFSLVRILLGPMTRDVNCAFKLFPRAIGLGLSSDGAMISTELIIRARAAGYTIAEVAVPHYPRTTGRSTGANFRVVLRAFGELWRLTRRRASPHPIEPPRSPT